MAAALNVSAPTISRMETGARAATPRNINALCDLYEVAAPLRAQLLVLGREASEQGWWHKYDDLAIDPLIGLEMAATQISTHEAANVPWAFQTEDYARAIIKGTLPGIDDTILEERVAARMTRQELLRGANPPRLWALIDESAFHRLVGGSHTMKAQLHRILEVAAAPNVTMQVVPFEAGAHPGLNNAFTLLEFADPGRATHRLRREPGRQPVPGERHGARPLPRSPGAPQGQRLQPGEIRHLDQTGLQKIRRASLSSSSGNQNKPTKGVFVVLCPDYSVRNIPWRKAAKSAATNCIKVARRNGIIVIGDTKNPAGPVLSYSRDKFDAFLDGAKKGEFDDFLAN